MAKGIVIAGTHSGCGKTTVTLGVISALKKRGLKIQSFKAGPDFIDTGLHRVVTGRPARNLDLWMCGEDYVRDSFHKNSTHADISVVEGVMGLYDGDFSTARLSHVLNLPVILVIDAYGMAESAGAVASGFKRFGVWGQECEIIGIIFNRVASEGHYKRLKESIRDIDILGYLPRDLSFEIPHRHLGLFVAEEDPISEENIERLTDTVLEHIDIEGIIGRSRKTDRSEPFNVLASPPKTPPTPLIRIAVAYDKAFCFYYEDNLDLLRDSGAEIVTFSPLSDSRPPVDADVIYIGGGYPELYADTLSKNEAMLNFVSQWARSGKPMYAECGGLMYLSLGIHVDGKFLPMAGVFPFETEMKKGRSRLGYREIILKDNAILGNKGDRLRGHEFHYSEIRGVEGATQAPVGEALSTHSVREGEAYTPGGAILDFRLRSVDFKSKFQNPKSEISREGATQAPVIALQYKVKDGSGRDMPDEGYRFKNTLASYIHIHFGSNPGAAKHLINLEEVQGLWP